MLAQIQACQNENKYPVIASVGEYNITEPEFIDRYEGYLNRTGIKDNYLIRKEVLSSMISELLLYYYDDNSNIFGDIDYQKELKWTDNQATLGYLKSKEIYSKIEVSDDELRATFLRSNQQLAARHLFATNEEEINNIQELLNIGVDFNTLAKQTFTDSTLRNNGGYLGYFSWGDMEPEFEDKVFSMKVGEISEPIKTQHGFSIVKLEDRITHPLLTESEYLRKKENLAQVLRIRKKVPFEKNYLNNVVKLSEIKFNDEAINSLWHSIQLNILRKEVLTDKTENLVDAVVYENRNYSYNEIKEKLNDIPQFHYEKITSKDKLELVIKGIILQEKLLEIAESKNYHYNETVIETQQKMQGNLFRKYKISEIIKNYSIEDSVVYNFYKSHPDYFSRPDEVNVQEILVEKLENAKKILADLKNGKDFSELAKTYSIRKESAVNDGFIGLAPLDKFGILKSLFSNCKINEILGPIEIGNIFGIFKVTQRINSQVIDYEKSKDVAATAVKFQLKSEIINQYIEDLKKVVDIKIEMENLVSIKLLN